MTATQKAAEAVAEPVRQETGPLVLAYVADGSYVADMLEHDGWNPESLAEYLGLDHLKEDA